MIKDVEDDMKTIEGVLNATGLRVALVVSRFNSFITDRLMEGAMDALVRHGARAEDVTVIRVPGAFELPSVTRRVAMAGNFDAVVCLAAVIRGGTPHFEYVAAEVSKGVAHVSLEAPCPVTFGILTCDSLEQAIERAGSKAGNKGSDAAMAAIEMADLFKRL